MKYNGFFYYFYYFTMDCSRFVNFKELLLSLKYNTDSPHLLCFAGISDMRAFIFSNIYPKEVQNNANDVQ